MNIVNKNGNRNFKPKKPDKKFESRIGCKKTAEKGLQILQNIKIKNEKNYMLIGMKNEGWTKSVVKTDGWMGKHVLWNKPTLQASVL